MSKSRIIDFHSHILPKMDDGSKGLEMSQQMLRKMRADGTDLVFATSHFYEHREDGEHFLRRRAAAFHALEEAREPDWPEIRLGAEVAFFSELPLQSSEILDGLCLQGTKTILIEMPFNTWSGYEVDALTSLTLDRGYQVLMAHFERFLDFGTSAEIWDRILQLPVTLQMNAGTLLPWLKRKKWLSYFADSPIPVLGSDSHNMETRAPNLGQARAILEKKFGANILRRIDQQGEKILQSTAEL